MNSDADHLFQRLHEDLAVAGLAGLGGALDLTDGLFDEFRAHRDVDADLRHFHDAIFRAPVDFRMASLSSEALDLRDGDALDADRDQRVAQFLIFMGPDNRGDHAHRIALFIFESMQDETSDRFRPGGKIRLLAAPAVDQIVELDRRHELNSLVKFFHIQLRTLYRPPPSGAQNRGKAAENR